MIPKYFQNKKWGLKYFQTMQFIGQDRMSKNGFIVIVFSTLYSAEERIW